MRWAGKGDEKGVALGPELPAALCTDGGANEIPVHLEQLRVALAELLDESSGALNVGEQEGDRPGGE
jgi:hypothetical protein